MQPSEKRNSIILGLLLLVVVICIGTLAVLLYFEFRQPSRPSEKPLAKAAAQAPAAAPRTWAGKYYYGGMPKPSPSFPDQITVLTNIGYVVGYCETEEDPAWVCYHLFKVSSFQAPPRPQGFQVDNRTRARIDQHDYSGSGYDRGHMAPNYAIALCYGSAAQLETFYMSNVIPQRPNLNRKVWEHLEQEEIKDYAPKFKQLWVIDGPVFKSDVRKFRCGVEIPDACFKILVEEENGEPRVLAFVMPQSVNGTESPAEYLTSVAEIEKETGLEFFSELPKDIETKLETETAKRMW